MNDPLFTPEYHTYYIMMNNLYHTQFLIHSIKLPYDITNEISSYLFYDKETTHARNELRKKICAEISRGFNSRNRTEHVEKQLNDEYLIIDYGENFAISAIYCRLCGNNIWIGLMDTRVWCKCCKKLVDDSAYINEPHIFDEYVSWRHSTYKKREYISMVPSGLIVMDFVNSNQIYND